MQRNLFLQKYWLSLKPLCFLSFFVSQNRPPVFSGEMCSLIQWTLSKIPKFLYSCRNVGTHAYIYHRTQRKFTNLNSDYLSRNVIDNFPLSINFWIHDNVFDWSYLNRSFIENISLNVSGGILLTQHLYIVMLSAQTFSLLLIINLITHWKVTFHWFYLLPSFFLYRVANHQALKNNL